MNGRDRTLQTLVGDGAFYECPRWHDGRLWVSDYWRNQVLAISPDGTAQTIVEVPGSPSGLGWLPDGTLLVVSMQDSKLLRVEDGGTVQHADLLPHAGPQSNDMVVDAAGGAYVSTIDFSSVEQMPTTNLVRVGPDGSVAVAAEGMWFPNGSVLTPDGATLIVAESWAQRLTAFDVQPDGSLANRRDWAQLGPRPATDPPGQPVEWRCAPDGIALDAEGAVWVADAAGKRALRVREGGEILEEVGAGDLDVVACALGGADGRTLFLCATSDFRLAPDEAARIRPARILTCTVDVPAAGSPRQRYGGSTMTDAPGPRVDARVDDYIDALPEWQQAICREVRGLVHAADPDVTETIKFRNRPYFVLQGNICALLAAKDHVNVFLYDGGIVPDPEGVITGGHDNKTARTVAIRQGAPINAPALTAIFRQIIANNRAGGWRRLKREA